jgi:hypothetical protein
VPTQIEVELLRRLQNGSLSSWLLNDDGTEPVADAVARTRLADILTALQGLLAIQGGEATEDTLAALLAAVEGRTEFPLPASQIATLTPPAPPDVSGLATEASLAAVGGTLATRATEATLLQVRDYLDTVETLIAAVRDRLPAGGASTESTLVGLLSRVTQGLYDEIRYFSTAAGGTKAFNVTSGLLTITSSGEQPLAAFVNPADSGVDVFIDIGEFGASANTTFRRYRGSTLSSLSNAITPSNMGGGANTAGSRLYTPPNYTRTSGTVTKTAHIAAFQQYVTEIKGRTRLKPGQSIAWTITGPGGLGGSMTATVYLEFWEAPAT